MNAPIRSAACISDFVPPSIHHAHYLSPLQQVFSNQNSHLEEWNYQISPPGIFRQASMEKTIFIVGGSLTGLMHGIALAKLGHRITIFERSLDLRSQSHMAGIALAPPVMDLLRQFGNVDESSLGVPSECLQLLDHQNRARVFLKLRRTLSSWDVLWEEFRDVFDQIADGDSVGASESRTSFWSGTEVKSVRIHERGVLVEVMDVANGQSQSLSCDHLLGADGANSIVRRSLLAPGVVEPKYAGYVAWRGVVPEEYISLETRRVFEHNATYFRLPGHHFLVYYIPGVDGTVENGKCLLNFCWYSNHDELELEEILTDVNGRRHASTVPSGQIQPDIWEERRKGITSLLPKPFNEVLSHISKPLCQVIRDYCLANGSFGDGRIFLVGEARTLLRPHIAFSTNQAAFDCQVTTRFLKGEITARQWEQQVVSFSYLHWRRSIWFGDWFQRPWYISILAGIRYWLAFAMYFFAKCY